MSSLRELLEVFCILREVHIYFQIFSQWHLPLPIPHFLNVITVNSLFTLLPLCATVAMLFSPTYVIFYITNAILQFYDFCFKHVVNSNLQLIFVLNSNLLIKLCERKILIYENLSPYLPFLAFPIPLYRFAFLSSIISPSLKNIL